MSISNYLAIADPEALCHQIQDFIYDCVTRRGKNGCILGISGGLDSSVVADLAVRAVGKENVEGLFMPERDTAPETYEDARLIAQTLGLPLKQIDLTPILRLIGVYDLEPSTTLVPRFFQETYVSWKYNKYSTKEEPAFLKILKGGGDQPELCKHISYFRTKHRLRMVLTYFYSELNNLLVLGTCNKTEKMIGLFVPYGDSACDIEPMNGLYKTQVKELARYLSIPEKILRKAPSHDLVPGLNDAKTVRVPYDRIDPILVGLELSMEDAEISRQTGADTKEIEYIKRLVKLSEPMRSMPDSPW